MISPTVTSQRSKRKRNDKDDTNVNESSDVKSEEPIVKTEEKIAPLANSNFSRPIREIMKDKFSGKPTKAFLKKEAERKERKKAKKGETTSTKEEPEIKPEVETKKEPAPPTENISNYAPQLRIVDGKIEVDQSTLVVSQITEEIHRDVIHETKTHVTSGTYLKRNPSEKWTEEELDKFYKALRQCGTDFSMIAKFFPNRNRRQIKNRFKKEEEINPSLVDKALRERLPLDVEYLKSVM